MPTLDWLLAAPMWVKASLSCLWWIAIYMVVRLVIWALTGGDFWGFDPFGSLSLAAISYLVGWKQRGQL